GRRGQRPQSPPAVFYLHSDRAHSCPGNRAVPRPAHLCRREVSLPPAGAEAVLGARTRSPPARRGGAAVDAEAGGKEESDETPPHRGRAPQPPACRLPKGPLEHTRRH